MFFEYPLAYRLPSFPAKEESVDAEHFCEWAKLIQAEYVEMPGLRLSKRQAQRLWSLDAPSCDAIFTALEAANFLKRHGEDSFVRADAGY
jgi:hypothetical protein